MPEYAFIGRSNVGKSSLINMLTGIKGLAKTSGTPGKTQLINHFTVNNQWYLVDLPGYGFAKVSQTLRSSWEGMIRNYLQRRSNLANVFALVDIRVPPMASDMELINWMGEKKIPFTIIFTKTDKLTKKKINDQVTVYKKKLLESWHELPLFILTSAENKTGKEEILSLIEETNRIIP